MIDTVLNLLFRCSHNRLTRPMTPVSKSGVPHGDPYVVCLDCGKQFPYDLKEMRVGKAIDRTHDSHVVPPKLPMARNTKMKYALLATVPLAILVGSVLGSKKSRTQPKPPGAGPHRNIKPPADLGSGI